MITSTPPPSVQSPAQRFRLPIAIAVIVLLTLVFCWKLAFTDLILARGDAYYFFYPLWAATSNADSGDLPLWTNDVFMGAPLLSDPQPGTLYPPNWLAKRAAPPDAIRISILIHITWATLGAFLLARRAVKLDVIPALVAGIVFGLGGHIATHVEQINQLQGLVWLPWALLALDFALNQPLLYTPLVGVVLAFQVLSGHTQTVFITGVGLGIYGLVAVIQNRAHGRAPLPTIFRRIIVLVGILLIAVGLAAVLSLAQLYPTLELTGLSNRGGGFNPQQAMAFSWNPLLAGRGLLPGYDAQIFGEYIAYIGVFGLALALHGVFAGSQRKWGWLALVVIGIAFAFGLYNPLYWSLAGLPGFNLFRVPARWLALFAIGAAMLAGLGAQALLDAVQRPRWRDWLPILPIIGLIALSTLLSDRAANEVDGSAEPGLITWAAWGAALLLFIMIVVLRPRLSRRVAAGLVLVVVTGELWLASSTMPYNDLAAPEAYSDGRMSVYQLKAYQQADESAVPPGRILSISNGFFDPGDKSTMTARYAEMGMTERATRYAFTAAKMKEMVAPNLPLVWGIPSVDGAGGGILPTLYYTQFTSLLLPDGMPRTIDGRLRELLAQPDCNGACIPDQRWLNLTNTRYLLLDKTYDLWQDGIAYDTAFTLRPDERFQPQTEFVGTRLNLLYSGDTAPALRYRDGELLIAVDQQFAVGKFKLAQITLSAPQSLPQLELVSDDPGVRLHALTLVDARTGDFMQIPLGSWRLALSSDIKLYENLEVLPRALIVPRVESVSDTWDGTESALTLMRDPEFDPEQTVIVAGEVPPLTDDLKANPYDPTLPPITYQGYEPTRVTLQVNTREAGGLLLTDAWYPGWRVTINGQAAPLYRANVMFRAVVVPAGQSEVIFEYAPSWLTWIFPVTGAAWVLVVIGFVTLYIIRKRNRSTVDA